jgi:hypothetical protein
MIDNPPGAVKRRIGPRVYSELDGVTAPAAVLAAFRHPVKGAAP